MKGKDPTEIEAIYENGAYHFKMIGPGLYYVVMDMPTAA
jgi:hypothetical protein